jgi:hypothetical protein
MKLLIKKQQLFSQDSILIQKYFNYRFVFISLLLIFMFSISSCKKDEKDMTGIMVNIKNISSYDFQSLVFEGVEFGTLNAGMECKYVKFEKVYYNLAYVKLYINGDEFIMQPIDYDAPELTVGNCTYSINIANYDERRLLIETLLEH